MKNLKILTLPLFFILSCSIVFGSPSFAVSRIDPNTVIQVPGLIQVARMYNEGTVNLNVSVKWSGVKADNSTVTLSPGESKQVMFNADKAGATYTGSLILTANYPKGPGQNPVIPEQVVSFTIKVLEASGGIGIETVYLMPAIIIGLAVALWRMRQ